jgi:hypothetical protein
MRDVLRRHGTPIGTARVVLLLGIVGAVTLEMIAADFSVAALVFGAWVALPFLLVLRRTEGTHTFTSGAICLAGAVLLNVTSLLAYRPSALTGSSTAGLVFLFLPLWQLLGVGILLLIVDRVAPRER